MRMQFAHPALAVVLLSGLLAACGGGGGDGPAPEPPAPSRVQALFDESTLASRGGSHQVGVSHIIDATGLRMRWAIISALGMDRSPFEEDAGATATPSAPASLLVLEGTPDTNFSNTAGSAFISGGALHFIRNNAPSHVRHSGDDVIIETLSTDGAYTRRERITSITKRELNGTLAEAPPEFRVAFRTLVVNLRDTVDFPAGAAYFKRTAVRVGTVLAVQDSDADPATDPQSATALVGSTIENTARLISVDLGDGAIRQVNGARCWVRNNPDELLAGGAVVFAASPSFAALCEVGGKVYLGFLQPDGAELGSARPVDTTFVRMPFTIRLNKAAADGLRAMVP